MYLAVKTAHVLFAAVSLGLFAFRGVAMLKGRQASRGAWRVLPHVLDTLLLACGIGLVLILGLDPLRTPWLEAKLLYVFAYILLGILAFRLPAPWRPWLFGAAIALFGFIVSVAFTHDPRGIFSLLG